MARGAIIEDGLVVSSGEQIIDDPDVKAQFDDFVNGLDGQSDELYYRVYRVPLNSENNPSVNSGQQIFLFKQTIGVMSYDEVLQKVKDDYMLPNERTAAVRIAGYQTNRKGILFNRVIMVEKPVKASSTLPSSTDDSSAIIKAIQQSNMQMMEFLSRLQPSQVVAPVDPMENMLKMATAMGQLMGALRAGVDPAAVAAQPKSLLQQLKELKEVKELAGDLLGGDGDADSGESDVVSIVKAVAPIALPLLRAQQQLNAQQPPQVLPPQSVQDIPPEVLQQTAQPAPTPQPRKAPMPDFFPPPKASPSEDEKMLAEISAQLAPVVEMAARGEDPEQVANMVADMLPESEQIDGALYPLLSSPQCVDRLGMMNPAIKDHRDWFEKFRLALLKHFEPAPG